LDQKRPKKKRRFLRLFLTIILLVVLLMLFGERLGLGTGDDLSLLSPSPVSGPVARPVTEPEVETPQVTAREIQITITETAIQVDGENYTRDTFAALLVNLDENTLFVLSDQQANYALFKEVEDLLKSKNLSYVIGE